MSGVKTDWCLLVLTAGAAVTSAQAQEYSIDFLGQHGSVYERNFDSPRITQSGYAVGSIECRLSSCQYDYWRYDGSDTVPLSFRPLKVNEAGQIAGHIPGASDEYSGRAQLFENDTVVGIGPLSADYLDLGEPTHTVDGLNEAGEVAGTAENFSTGSTNAWIYDGSTIEFVGLAEPDNLDPAGLVQMTVQGLSENGHVFGLSTKHATEGMPVTAGWQAWVAYDGATNAIEFAPEFTQSDGFHDPTISFVADNGYAAGRSLVWDEGDQSLGNVAWHYNGVSAVEVGPTDAVHSSYYSSGQRISEVLAMDAAGHVVGRSERNIYDPYDSYAGYSIWYYDGTTSRIINPEDSAHRKPNGYRYSGFKDMSKSGFVVGTSNRWDNLNVALRGVTAWLFDGNETIEIGLSGGKYTIGNGKRYNYVVAVNEAGQAVGHANRSGGGSDAWFYDGTTTIAIQAPQTHPFRYISSSVNYLTDDGTVLGNYSSYNEDGNFNPSGSKGFKWTADGGFEALDDLVDESLEGWEAIRWVSGMAADGTLVGRAYRPEVAAVITAVMKPLPVLDAAIDVLPASPANEIDPAATGNIPVAVLTTSISAGDAVDFDATQVRYDTVKLGPGEAPNLVWPSWTDVDGDADIDVVFEFSTAETALSCDDTELELTGETHSGLVIKGIDTIVTTNCDTGGCHP
jgi:hypothetical protein